MHEESDAYSSHDLATAHILIKCKSDYLKDVMEQFRSIEDMVEILEVNGECDIVAKIEACLQTL